MTDVTIKNIEEFIKDWKGQLESARTMDNHYITYKIQGKVELLEDLLADLG